MYFATLFNEENQDSWISGLGSALGALTAGVITGVIGIFVMKKRLNYDTNRRNEQIRKKD